MFFYFPPTEGAALPLTPDPTPSASPPQPKTTKSVQKRLPSKPQRRSAESCRSGDSYVREKFRPGPISMFLKLTPLLIQHLCVLTGLYCKQYIALYYRMSFVCLFVLFHFPRRLREREEKASEYIGNGRRTHSCIFPKCSCTSEPRCVGAERPVSGG